MDPPCYLRVLQRLLRVCRCLTLGFQTFQKVYLFSLPPESLSPPDESQCVNVHVSCLNPQAGCRQRTPLLHCGVVHTCSSKQEGSLWRWLTENRRGGLLCGSPQGAGRILIWSVSSPGFWVEGEHEPGALLLTTGVRLASPLPHHVQHLQASAAVVLEPLLDFRSSWNMQLFWRSAVALTGCMWLPGYLAASFTHYSSLKYEIKWPREQWGSVGAPSICPSIGA